MQLCHLVCVLNACLMRLTFVPGLAVLPSTSDVGDGQHSAQMSDKDEARDAVTGGDGDVKASIAIEETRVGAIQFDALLVNDEHGDLSAILGGVEDLTSGGGKEIAVLSWK